MRRKSFYGSDIQWVLREHIRDGSVEMICLDPSYTYDSTDTAGCFTGMEAGIRDFDIHVADRHANDGVLTELIRSPPDVGGPRHKNQDRPRAAVAGDTPGGVGAVRDGAVGLLLRCLACRRAGAVTRDGAGLGK